MVIGTPMPLILSSGRDGGRSLGVKRIITSWASNARTNLPPAMHGHGHGHVTTHMTPPHMYTHASRPTMSYTLLNDTYGVCRYSVYVYSEW
jgi:hypothetical protein